MGATPEAIWQGHRWAMKADSETNLNGLKEVSDVYLSMKGSSRGRLVRLDRDGPRTGSAALLKGCVAHDSCVSFLQCSDELNRTGMWSNVFFLGFVCIVFVCLCLSDNMHATPLSAWVRPLTCSVKGRYCKSSWTTVGNKAVCLQSLWSLCLVFHSVLWSALIFV